MEYNSSIGKEKLKDFIIKYSQVEKDKIQNDSMFMEGGFLDSLGFMALISYMEEEFQIKVSDEDLMAENFKSINTLSDFIERKTIRQ